MTVSSRSFTDVLQEQRDLLNGRFAMRVRAGARIDAQEFLDHLRDRVAPLIRAIDAERPERTRIVLLSLYDASLDLFASSLLGSKARLPEIRQVWDELLPAAVPLIARDPQTLVGALCNAAFQVARQPGARPAEWIARLRPLVAECASTVQLLEVGVLIAWQAGLAQFRPAALDAAGRLPTALAVQVLRLPPDTSSQRLQETIQRMRRDPWFEAATSVLESSQRPSLVAAGRMGAFAGFGGLFAKPPVVSSVQGRLYVCDQQSTWELIADVYGVWFRRTPPVAESRAALPPTAGIDRRGHIQWGNLRLTVPYLANATSVAGNESTLAITIPTSHHLFLFARTGVET